jgi:hypothetical protein
MKERPILFSGPMVRAIREGRKTQTRRVMKPQPAQDDVGDGLIVFRYPATKPTEPHFRWVATRRPHEVCPYFETFCPYGVPGDRLWVKEAWQHEDTCCDDHRCGQPTHIYHKATEVAPDTFASWRPSIHMPRWASRIDLEVTGVRVERLQEISREDARAEGVEPRIPGQLTAASLDEYLYAFRDVWDSLNGKRGSGWDADPWVWVIEFRVLTPPRDGGSDE